MLVERGSGQLTSVSDPINVPVQNAYVRFSKSLQDSATSSCKAQSVLAFADFFR